MEKLSIEKPLLHIFVCINDRTNLPEPKKPDCGPKINKEEIIQIKRTIKDKDLKSKIKITFTNCLGICSSKGPVILLQPMQEYYIINSTQDILDIIKEKTQINLS
jgi:predicted metal-binding protein